MNYSLPVSGSIVLYKNDETVSKAIQSFLSTPMPVKLFLVDNSPTDALQTTLQQVISDKRVEYIFNNENIGYGGGHNIAIRKSVAEGFPYHFVMNPDVEFAADTIPSLTNYMQSHADVGLAMPKVLYPNGDVQYVCKLLPTPADFFVKRFLPRLYTRGQRDRFEMRTSGYNQVMEVPFLSGCFMALRKEAIEQCGMFDERYFMYAEDIDLTRRIRQRFKTIFYPHASVVHGYEAASYKSVKMFVILFTNIGKYFNKWGWIWDAERGKINNEVLVSMPSGSPKTIAG